MSIFVIADLHLSFKNPKPMDIFGDNWTKHEEKIKKDWNEKVKEEDLVVLPGDFSWATYIEDTIPDFEYLNSLPGKKIMLKGNHDYWWTTVTSMRKFLKENKFQNKQCDHTPWKNQIRHIIRTHTTRTIRPEPYRFEKLIVKTIYQSTIGRLSKYLHQAIGIRRAIGFFFKSSTI